MIEYRAVFKCRICGELFMGVVTGSRKTAERATLNASLGVSSIPMTPHMYDIHYCEDGGIGIADFHGFMKIGNGAGIGGNNES